MIAHPVSFEGLAGIFHPARKDLKRDRAVLFVSPWGMEELCSRKFQRVLAERLAASGVASLRFDYLGAGDALDPEDAGRMADWFSDTRAALDYLTRLSGCSGVVVVAQGLGCPIAAQALAGSAAVDSMAFLAPVVSGRGYLRELAMWSSMIDDGLGLLPGQRLAEAGAIAGTAMPAGIADRIKKVNLSGLDAIPARSFLVLSRPGRVTDGDFARHLAAIGGEVEEAEFCGYDDLVSSPTLSKISGGVVNRLVDWVLSQTHAGNPAAVPEDFIINDPQRGRGFFEQPVQFGEGGRLFGIFADRTIGNRFPRSFCSVPLMTGIRVGAGFPCRPPGRLHARVSLRCASMRPILPIVRLSKTSRIRFFTMPRRMTMSLPHSIFSGGAATGPSLRRAGAAVPISLSTARLPMIGSVPSRRSIRWFSTGKRSLGR